MAKYNFSEPLHLKVFLYDKLFICGCAELDEVRNSLLNVLRWMDSRVEKKKQWYYELGMPIGIYYMIVGLLDGADLCEHGISSRHPFLTPDGYRFLDALSSMSAEQIESASGMFDGIWYGDLSEIEKVDAKTEIQ